MLNTIAVIAISKISAKESDSEKKLTKFQQRRAIPKIAYNKIKDNILGLSEYLKLKIW